MQSAVSTFGSNNGQPVFYRNWKTDGMPKGIVLIVHGLNSHSGYYQNFALALTENHFEVYAMDLRGRGNSEGERCYIHDYWDVIADIDQLLHIARSAFPVLPFFLFGHSAGGVLASIYALHHQHQLKGLVAESLAFMLPAHALELSLMKALGHIIPHIRLVKLKNSDFSRDRFIVETMNKDPLLKNERQPVKTMQQLILAAEYLKKEMLRIRLPLLILHGTADKVTKPEGSRYFMEHASSTDKQLKLYEGHYHDLLNDKYNGIILKNILQWFTERI